MSDQIESIDVLPSEDNGNVIPDPVVSPNPEPQDPAAAVPVEPVAPTSAEPELFELPDGRKVDGATLTKEWKENFLPDYTRKSQALAAKDTPNAPLQPNPADPLADPDFVPQTYAELAEAIRNSTFAEIERKEQERASEAKAIEDTVATQLNEVKTLDPAVNENDLFLHATKYGFRDLKTAYQNMKDMRELTKTVQQTTAKNIAKRADPVSASPGAIGARPDPTGFETARDYLRSIKT